MTATGEKPPFHPLGTRLQAYGWLWQCYCHYHRHHHPITPALTAALTCTSLAGCGDTSTTTITTTIIIINPFPSALTTALVHGSHASVCTSIPIGTNYSTRAWESCQCLGIHSHRHKLQHLCMGVMPVSGHPTKYSR